MTLLHLDAREFTDAKSMHRALADAFGFPASYGHNLDALVDCLTELDNPKAAMSRIHVGKGDVLTVAIDHVDEAGKGLFLTLIRAIGFVNWRRVESGRAPVLSFACSPD